MKNRVERTRTSIHTPSITHDSFQSVKGNEEVEYLEDRLGIEKELQFEFNKKKKFNCLTKPVPYCLSDAKGRKSSINKMEARDSQTSD